MIRLKQVDTVELAAYISSISTGTPLAEALDAYFGGSGFVGNHVVYSSGGNQLIKGEKHYEIAPFVPSGIEPSGAANKQYVDASISGVVISQSGFNTGAYVRANFSNTFTASNTFTQNIFIPRAQQTGHGVNLFDLRNVSGVLQSGLDNISIAGVIYDYGTQHLTGQKIFDVSPLAVSPSSPSGVVTLNYLTGNFSVTNAVSVTGNQNISGVKTFLNSPKGPLGVNPTDFVTKQQLDALGISMGGINGFAGVISINAQSGASGHLFFQGAGNVSVSNCGDIFTFSGQEPNATQVYSNLIELQTGSTGARINFTSGFGQLPAILGNLQSPNSSNFILETLYNVSESGFNISFSNPIPSTGYYYSFLAAPSLSSGYLGLKGEQGIRGPAGQNGVTPNLRGGWQNGVVYNVLDVIYLEPNSYAASTQHFSSLGNSPSGTGNAVWQIFSSGIARISGSWNFRGDFDTGLIYQRTDAVYLSGSTYGFSGIVTSGILPSSLTGGWHYIARQGDPGPSGATGPSGPPGSGGVTNFSGIHFSYSADFGNWMGVAQDDFYVTGVYVVSDGANSIQFGTEEYGFQFQLAYTEPGDFDNNTTVGPELNYETGLKYKFYTSEFNPPILVPHNKIFRSFVYVDENDLGARQMTVMGYKIY